MYCSECGKENDEGRRFCSRCGNALKNQGGERVNTTETNPETGNYTPQTKTGGGFNPMPYLITAVVIVFIISAAAVTVSLLSRPGGNPPETFAYDGERETEEITENEETEVLTEEKTEAVTEAQTEEQTEAQAQAAAVQTETEIGPPTLSNFPADDSSSEYYAVREYAPELMENFYGYAWVQTTNNHDSSYVADFCFDDSPIYTMLGYEYWQERPNVQFKRIYDVTIYDVVQYWGNSSGKLNYYGGDSYYKVNDYDVYVSYKYELYNSETGKTSSNIELAIDHVSWDHSYANGNEKHTLLMYDHTWINDLPLGTTITIDDFK